MVYGTTLCIPGEFFTKTTDNLDHISYVAKLKTMMRQIKPTPVRKQQPRKAYVSDDLFTCSFVFVRHDAVKRPLQLPYDGPFPVVQRSDKHFTLDILGQKKVVSLDCLKAAYIDIPTLSDIPSTTPPSGDSTSTTQPVTTTHQPTSAIPRTTRSGRHVRG